MRATLETYSHARRSPRPSPLIILPETALPLFLEQVPQDYLAALAAQRAQERRRRPDRRARAHCPAANTTTAWSRCGTAPPQTYRKSHLVPFGEFIPLRPVLAWIVGVLAIPLQDFSRGAEDQRPLAVAGPARGGQHLLRGRVRRGDHPPAAGGDAARQRQQRRLVRPLDRAAAAPADLAGARAGDRPLHAARDQHRRDRA